ncbi:MAG: tetratricopeptide repeat protein, partial [Chitinophagaceae bacterium]
MKHKTLFFFAVAVLLLADVRATVTDSLNAIMRTSLTTSEKIEALISVGIKVQHEDRAASILMHRKAVELCRSIGDANQEIRALHNLGNFYLLDEKNDSARAIMSEGLELARKCNNEKFIAKLLNNIGVTWSNQNKVGTAIVFYMESTKFDRHDTLRLAKTFNNISVIFLEMHQFAKAEQYAAKALKFALEMNDSLSLALAYSQLGTLMRRQGNTEGSDNYYKKALQYREAMVDPYHRMLVYQNYGVTLNQRHRFAEASRYADTALVLGLQNGSPVCVAYGHHLKGVIALEEKKWPVARHYLNLAEKAFAEGGSWGTRMEVYHNLAELEKETGNTSEALAYMEKYNRMKDSAVRSQSASTVEFLEAQYQFEGKQKEILQLQKEKELQSVSLQQKNTINYLLVGALLVVLAVMLLLYYNYKQKQLLQQKVMRQMETDQELLATRMVIQGQEEERKRLAADLHDGLGGMLSGVKHSFQ